MKDELLIIGNYHIEVTEYCGWWFAHVLDAHEDIETHGETREEAVDTAMDRIRLTRPIDRPFDHPRFVRPKSLQPSRQEIARGLGFNRR